MCSLRQKIGRIATEYSTMPATLVSPAFDRAALERIAHAPASDEVDARREHLLDAQAELRLILDTAIIQGLKRAALVLLTAKWPSFDTSQSYSYLHLEQIQQLCEDLQNRIEELMAASVRGVESSSDPRVKAWFSTVSDAGKQAVAYAEDVRWAAMNAQAEAEIASGSGKSFANMDIALSYLAKLR